MKKLKIVVLCIIIIMGIYSISNSCLSQQERLIKLEREKQELKGMDNVGRDYEQSLEPDNTDQESMLMELVEQDIDSSE